MYRRGAARRTLARLLCVFCASLHAASAAGADDAGSPLGCDGEWAHSPLCVERAKALDTRAKIEALLAVLATVQRPPWEPAELAAANALFEDGMALYRDEYFGDAAAKFVPALARIETIRADFDRLVDTTLQDGDTHLANDAFAAALTAFERVLAWQPDSQAAHRGAARAKDGQRIENGATEAMRLLEAGHADAVAAVLAGLPVNVPSAALDQARIALRKHREYTRVVALLTAGHGALDRKDWSAAESAFRDALAVDAESAAAADGLAETLQRGAETRLAALRTGLANAFDEEDWAGAVAIIERIAAIDPDAAEADKPLARGQRLVAIEARLDEALADTQRAASQRLRDETRALLADTTDANIVGTRIHGKSQALRSAFERWTTPVSLFIRSDNKTRLLIRPGRTLGTLTSTELDVFPGRYALIGRRSGYREKKLNLLIEPGDEPLVVELICDERF